MITRSHDSTSAPPLRGYEAPEIVGAWLHVALAKRFDDVLDEPLPPLLAAILDRPTVRH